MQFDFQKVLATLKNKKYVFIAGGLVLIILIGYMMLNGVRHDAINYETALSAQYDDNRNELSAYISTFYEQLGIANKKSEKLNTILIEAVKGRYDEGSTAKPEGGKLFSAMVEAYPDLAGLNVYDKVVDSVSSGRAAYKDKQSKLLDMIRTYDKWRNEDFIRSLFYSLLGYPSNNLRATVEGRVLKGDAALEQMRRLVLTSKAVGAYDTGKMEPLQVENIVFSVTTPDATSAR